MAVLVEANSVIVRWDAIRARVAGGEESFIPLIPNRSACSDRELVRVGFLRPEEARAFVALLERAGLRFQEDGKAGDLVVVDQLRGPITPCDWIEFARIPFGPDQRVAVCWLYTQSRLPIPGIHLTGMSMPLATPAGWTFEGSLSEHPAFVPHDQTAGQPAWPGTEGPLTVYLDPRTRWEGPTTRPIRPDDPPGSAPHSRN